MKRKINYGKNKINKDTIKIIILSIFLIYLSLVLSNISRKYLIIENVFKGVSSSINSTLINKFYKTDYANNNFNDARVLTLEKENNELKKLLEIKESNNNYVFSIITNHSLNLWYNKVMIDKGTLNNIKKGNVVLNNNGLVGFISKTGKGHSEVDLITNINEDNMISVLIISNDNFISGVLSGYDSDKNLFKITNVTSKDKINKDDKVVLSGYDNNDYKDIYVGKVVKEKTSNFGLSKTIYVKSEVDFDNLLYVMVKESDKK